MKFRRNLAIVAALAALPLLATLIARAGGCGDKPAAEAAPVLGQFFQRMRAGDPAGAMALTSRSFQAASNQKVVVDFLAATGLDKVTGTKFTSSLTCDGTIWVSEINGSVRSEAGIDIPLTGSLVIEDGAWKVQLFNATTAIDNPLLKEAGTPDKTYIAMLSRGAMMLFVSGLVDKDMAKFRAYTSRDFQATADNAALTKAFEPLFAYAEPGMKAAADVELSEFSPTPNWLNGAVLLTAKGVYKTTPRPFDFDITYTFERPEWRVSKIHVTAGNSQESLKSLPTIAKADFEKLAHDTLKLFLQATAAGNMAPYRDTVSDRMKSQYSAADFDTVFKRLFAQAPANLIDALPVVITEFPQTPTLQSDIVSVPLKGYVDTKPSLMNFELVFLRENGAWKTNAINVDFKTP